ncbi:uncharacterized protein LOC125212804 [Salvia hispanica]|uniref:uncharacterized protein LOC125212804 n=1 Tax=Salvia hispanica TaxID=49212 RepID=UPI00200935A0|nr:uncharacterized protein LOC125212804 [Salvia hispanica]
MESLLCEKWELQPRHSSKEVLQRWRDLCSVVKNPKRRFRFTANITKRQEAARMCKTNQEKLMISVLVSKAAFDYSSSQLSSATNCHEAAQPISISQLSSATNHRTEPPYPIPPFAAAFPMAEEFVSAFRDLQNNATNNEKLVEFVRCYYVNNLKAPEFCSALKLHLNPTHHQPPNDPPFIIVQNFFHEISRLSTNHQMMENALNSMNTNFTKQLHSIAVSNKVYSVLLNAATMICAAVAEIAVADVILMRGWARAGVGAVVAVASIVFAALGEWHRSVLMDREAAVKKHKVIIDHMITLARPIMTDLSRIYSDAHSLRFEIKSLSEAVDGQEKLAAVENCLLHNVEKFNSAMNLAKDLVLKSIFEQLD